MKRGTWCLALVTSALALSVAAARAADFPCRWSSYTTRFATGVDGRETNIRLSAEKLDGTVLLPGVEFSFNENVGSRIEEDKTAYAATLVGDRRVPGDGGGICQTASTFYYAALLAGVSIRERRSHSAPVSYIPPGLDATVFATEGIDLKLQNPFRSPLLVRASVSGAELTVAFYGTEPRPREILVRVSPPSRDGAYLRTTTTRIVREHGKELFREIISRDRYRLPE